MKEKITEFVTKYGYTYTGIFVTAVLFPPAAIFITWKKPEVLLIVRILLTLLILSPTYFVIYGGVELTRYFSS